MASFTAAARGARSSAARPARRPAATTRRPRRQVSEAALAASTLCLLNEERTSRGLRALRVNRRLSAAAEPAHQRHGAQALLLPHLALRQRRGRPYPPPGLPQRRPQLDDRREPGLGLWRAQHPAQDRAAVDGQPGPPPQHPDRPLPRDRASAWPDAHPWPPAPAAPPTPPPSARAADLPGARMAPAATDGQGTPDRHDAGPASRRPAYPDGDASRATGLTDAQQVAVTHPGGPLLVTGAAGSGRTTVLEQRLAWLAEQGAPRRPGAGPGRVPAGRRRPCARASYELVAPPYDELHVHTFAVVLRAAAARRGGRGRAGPRLRAGGARGPGGAAAGGAPSS